VQLQRSTRGSSFNISQTVEATTVKANGRRAVRLAIASAVRRAEPANEEGL
jgi:hypothetical protein